MASSRDRIHHHGWHVLRLLPWLIVLPLFATRCATYSSSTEEPDAYTFTPIDEPDSGNPSKDAGKIGSDATADFDAVTPDGGDAGIADASDGASPQQGFCAGGQKEVGEFATWGGKVNVHKPAAGAWSVDSDCSSGAGINTLAYCQKFFPTATVLVHLAAVTSEMKPFTQGGGSAPNCGGLALHPGVDQFACCAPAGP